MSIRIGHHAETLLAMLQASRPAVAAHSRRVAGLATRIAIQYGLAAETIEAIHFGALLHDVGKLLVPGDILEKAGRLTSREWHQLRQHPELGAELVENAEVSDEVCEIILFHHECEDGTGYPDRLVGRAIPFAVRIVSVADAFDALTTRRAYREPLSLEAARAAIGRQAGKRYCPWVASALLSLPLTLLETKPPAVVDYQLDGLPDRIFYGLRSWTLTP